MHLHRNAVVSAKKPGCYAKRTESRPNENLGYAAKPGPLPHPARSRQLATVRVQSSKPSRSTACLAVNGTSECPVFVTETEQSTIEQIVDGQVLAIGQTGVHFEQNPRTPPRRESSLKTIERFSQLKRRRTPLAETETKPPQHRKELSFGERNEAFVTRPATCRKPKYNFQKLREFFRIQERAACRIQRWFRQKRRMKPSAATQTEAAALLQMLGAVVKFC